MIYLFDDSSDSYVRKHIDVADYSDVLSFHPQMSAEGLEGILDEIRGASCVMLHSSFRDSDDHGKNRVFDTLAYDVCDMGRYIPIVIFSDGFDDPKFKGSHCIRQMKKSLFYQNLSGFLEKYRQKETLDLMSLAYGESSGKVIVVNEGTNVLNRLTFCQPDEKVNVELVAGTSLKKLVEMSQPEIGIAYVDLVNMLRSGRMTVADFRDKLSSIIRSFSQFGFNTVKWDGTSEEEEDYTPDDLVKISGQIPSSHEEIHDFMMELFADPGRESVVIDSRMDLTFSLKLAMHIRMSLEFIGMKALCPIVLISELGAEALARTSPFAQILLTEHVYVSPLTGLRTCLRNITPMKLENYAHEFLSKVNVEPPSYSENDRHGLANQWGAGVLYRSVTGHRFRDHDCPALLTAQKELYFKYIMMCTCDDLQSLVVPSKRLSLSDESLKVNASGKRILLIDDMADKGWERSLREFLPGASIDVINRQVMDYSEYSPNEKAMIRDEEYDLYLLDLRLGGIREEDIYDTSAFSGAKVLHEIKRFNRGRQVIMFTASNKTWNSRTLLSPGFGADGYYVKENPSFKFPETFSRKSIEAFAAEVRRCFSRNYLKDYWDFKERTFLCLGDGPALFEECGRQVDMAFDLANWATTGDQFRHAFVSAEQVFEVMSKCITEETRELHGSHHLTVRKMYDAGYEDARKVYTDRQNRLLYRLAEMDPLAKDSISMFDKLSVIYLQHLGATDNGLLFILNQLVQIRNRIMHSETKEEQAKQESQNRVLSRKEFIERYKTKAPAFADGTISDILLELSDRGILREASNINPINGIVTKKLFIPVEVAEDKAGIQLLLECMKAFFDKMD